LNIELYVIICKGLPVTYCKVLSRNFYEGNEKITEYVNYVCGLRVEVVSCNRPHTK